MTSKKTSLKNILYSVLLISIAALVLCSCSQNNSEAQTNPVIRRTFQRCGPYIYADWGITYRYNINTQSFGSACLDPTCDGTCLPEQLLTYVNQSYDNKLFIGGVDPLTRITKLGYQDVISGEEVVLKEVEGISAIGSIVNVWEDQMYYGRKVLNEGGDKTNPDDYTAYICRMSIYSGEEEVLYESEGKTFCIVQDDLIIMNKDDVFYSVNINTWEEKVLFDIREYGFIFWDSNTVYTNGKMYLLCQKENDYFYSEYRGNISKSYLMSFDIHTGEVVQLSEEPIIGFTVNEKGIYYMKQAQRLMYIPEDYDGDPNTVVMYYGDGNLHFMNFDGSGEKIVYTNLNLDFAYMGLVIDDVLYGWFSDYNEEAHDFGRFYFGGVNLKTGEIIRKARE